MTRPIRLVLLGVALVVVVLSATRVATSLATAEESAAPPPPTITFFDGSGWSPLENHGISLQGPGATIAGSATATFKAKLDGPKTFAVLAGATSQVLLSVPRPRFRIAADRTGAIRVQLAQFEALDENRRTTVERLRNGYLFTKGVDLEVMEVTEGLWELRPTKSLQPGEYALATSDTDPVFDFTIFDTGN
jgi:hypothetical protein